MLFMWLILHQLFDFCCSGYEAIGDCFKEVDINDAASNETCQLLIFGRDCKNPNLYPIILARCPATCGLCDQPGVLGECPDRSDNCATIIGLDPKQCNKTSVANMCMKSCNLKTCLSGKCELKESILTAGIIR
ncbi:unnamed protein product [Dracunculus medinensis]|uniref:ShKT domain-containing protein n=1 Tax=Dracunculus medinensis TaxID=318479 RepID=A0A0N4UR03_DRAME|nr:unnamed protein product [Dracunculus medinensis]